MSHLKQPLGIAKLATFSASETQSIIRLKGILYARNSTEGVTENQIPF